MTKEPKLLGDQHKTIALPRTSTNVNEKGEMAAAAEPAWQGDLTPAKIQTLHASVAMTARNLSGQAKPAVPGSVGHGKLAVIPQLVQLEIQLGELYEATVNASKTLSKWLKKTKTFDPEREAPWLVDEVDGGWLGSLAAVVNDQARELAAVALLNLPEASAEAPAEVAPPLAGAPRNRGRRRGKKDSQ